ncbi:MAG: undecaprenyl-diphosphate phosphatase [Desulfatiglandaceae bacterium]
METIETIFLGIVQGLTEFLPVSSSGHLVIFQNLFGMSEPELLLDISLHLGTLLAVCLYFRSDLKKMGTDLLRFDFETPHARLVLWVLVGSIPTGLIGIVFKTPLEKLFGSLTLVGVMLVATGFIVGCTRLLQGSYGNRMQIGLLTALAVGVAQGLAIMPGISRSGATIVCALFCRLDRELAARFSFLLSIPAITGALLLHLDQSALEKVGFVPLFLGFAASTLVGVFALKFLMGMVKKGHLYYFAPYCWALGLVIVLA